MKESKVDHIKLPQAAASIITGASAVISLWIVLLVTRSVGFPIIRHFNPTPNAWVLVFTVFALADAIHAKIKRSKNKRKRRYPPLKKH